MWLNHNGTFVSPSNMAGYAYVGPCLTPAEVEALDNPERDATDFAHPAWWRGNDAGVAAVVRMLNEQLDGKPMLGTTLSPELQALRERISRLMTKAP